MTARDMIKQIEQKRLEDFSSMKVSRSTKISFIVTEIANACQVSQKTVRNWKAGGTVGVARKMVLKEYMKKVLEEENESNN